jgi:hypothetical protein
MCLCILWRTTPINDPGIPLHSIGEARHTYWLSPSARRRRGHCQRPQVRIGAQGQSYWRVSCGHEQGVGVADLLKMLLAESESRYSYYYSTGFSVLLCMHSR